MVMIQETYTGKEKIALESMMAVMPIVPGNYRRSPRDGLNAPVTQLWTD